MFYFVVRYGLVPCKEVTLVVINAEDLDTAKAKVIELVTKIDTHQKEVAMVSPIIEHVRSVSEAIAHMTVMARFDAKHCLLTLASVAGDFPNNNRHDVAKYLKKALETRKRTNAGLQTESTVNEAIRDLLSIWNAGDS